MQKVDPAPSTEENGPGRKPARGEKLSEEIRIVRKLISMINRMISEDKGLDKMLEVLDTVSRSSANLASLLRAEKALEENQTASDYLKSALADIREDMKRNGIDSILTSGL